MSFGGWYTKYDKAPSRDERIRVLLHRLKNLSFALWLLWEGAHVMKNAGAVTSAKKLSPPSP